MEDLEGFHPLFLETPMCFVEARDVCQTMACPPNKVAKFQISEDLVRPYGKLDPAILNQLWTDGNG